mgnify:CR=1 FL=1
MNLYVIRHGTTNANEQGVIQGRRMGRLSKTGEKDLEKLAKDFENTKIDIIVSSPLMRTLQTAKIYNQYHNVKIVKDDLLLEVEEGVFTGRKHSSLSDEERKIIKSKLHEYGMESVQDVKQRMQDFLDTIKEKYPYENVAIVTHNMCASIIERLLKGLPIEKDDETLSLFSNGQVKLFKI